MASAGSSCWSEFSADPPSTTGHSRRATSEGVEVRPGNVQAVQAMVPLAEMFGYATDLRSASQGRATYTMQFKHYEEVPNNIAQEIVESVKG